MPEYYISSYINMTTKAIGLGTQLRHILSLLDGDVQKVCELNVPDYRPRFTPVVRALIHKSPSSIQDIVAFTGLTQPAASQTVSLMLRQGWLVRELTADGRQSAVAFTEEANNELPKLRNLWSATRSAADQLDEELEYPISTLLEEAIRKLEEYPFIARIQDHRK